MDVTAAFPPVLTEEPLPLACDCGSEWPWVWWSGRGRIGARWAAPKLNPCPHCAEPPELARKRAVDFRMLRAGFPNRVLGFELVANRLLVQASTEKARIFRGRVLASEDRRLGVTRGNKRAIWQLMAWKPRKWVLLHGPPGTGKTTLMAAMARRLLDVRPEVLEELPGRALQGRPADALAYIRARGLDERRRRQRPTACRYIRLDDLVDRQRLSWRGDPEPLFHITMFSGVLFLDELGLHDQATIHKTEVECVQKLITARWEHGLCTVCSTNRTPEELTGEEAIYGDRVADRLSEALVAPLRGDSWRRRRAAEYRNNLGG